MKTNIDALRTYLKEVAKLETENFRIYIEAGKATAQFDETEMFNVSQTLNPATISFTATDPLINFLMRNDYTLSLHVSNYGGDLDMLIRLVLFFMHDKFQKVDLNYVIEDNNNATADIWIDVEIFEYSRNDGEGVHIC